MAFTRGGKQDRIKLQKGMGDYGDFNPVPPTIRIGRKMAEKEPVETYFTAIHESAHCFDHSRSSGLTKRTAYDYSTKVVKKALKNLGLASKGKQVDRLIYEMDYGRKRGDDYSEFFANSVEYGEAGRGNRLSKEIYRMVKEGDLP